MFTLSIIRYGERITEDYKTLDHAIDAAVMILDNNAGYVEGVITKNFELIKANELFVKYQNRIDNKIKQGQALTHSEGLWHE